VLLPAVVGGRGEVRGESTPPDGLVMSYAIEVHPRLPMMLLC
jgi:hypothetical protein